MQDNKSSLFLNGALSESSECHAVFELPEIDVPRLSAGAQRVSVPAGGSIAPRSRRLSLHSGRSVRAP